MTAYFLKTNKYIEQPDNPIVPTSSGNFAEYVAMDSRLQSRDGHHSLMVLRFQDPTRVKYKSEVKLTKAPEFKSCQGQRDQLLCDSAGS